MAKASEGSAPAQGIHRSDDERVLILAPRGRNAEMVANVLRRLPMDVHVCNDVDELCRELSGPTGVVIVSEEAFEPESLNCLVATLAQQPPWSEVPLLVLTGGGTTTRASLHLANTLGPRGNVTLVERPVRILTLVSAVRAALRARRRQYEVRDLLARERSARAEAEAASQAKDRFLAALSHELRTPLNPVLMTVSALLNDPLMPSAYRDDLNLVKRHVELEARLIDDLLDLTRISRGKLGLQPEAVDLHALIEQAVKACCESDIIRKELKLVTELRATRPYVWGDPARLTQVFWNLIHNAVKFTPEGGRITIRTANAAGDGGSVTVSIMDTGVGIDKETISRIFDAFEQGSRSVTRRYGGLGLGLAICKALVELHGGTIAAESEGHGRGATFVVRLDTILPSELRAPPVTNAPAGQERVQTRRILLVEDHDATARVMARLLRALGHEVEVARSVASAKQLAEAGTFDLIVSDLGLPDGTGLELMRHLRVRHRGAAIAVSGYGMEEDIRQSREAGFDEHIVKPIDVPKLEAAIQRVLNGHEPSYRTASAE